MKKDLKYIFFVIFLYIFVFQNLLQNIFPLFKYFDEIFALTIIPTFLIILKNKTSIKKYDLYLIGCLLLIFLIGLFSNMFYKIQSKIAMFEDMLLFYKFFMAMYLGKIMLNSDFIDSNSKKIGFHLKFIIYILFICTILNYIFTIWPSEYRFNIMTNQIFYGHASSLAAVCILILGTYFMINKENKIFSKEIIMLLLILISTLRFKAIGTMILIVLMILYVSKTKKKLTLSKLGIVALLIVIFAWNQISYYYIDLDGSARSLLTVKSIEVAKDYFPIGAGFGTFGSYISGTNYSTLYYEYGLSNVFGLTKNDPAFLSDTFWPMIIGQFGMIGLLLYVIILYLIYKQIEVSFSREKINIYLSKMICFSYLLISSSSESAFVHPMAIPLAILIGITVIEKRQKNEL